MARVANINPSEATVEACDNRDIFLLVLYYRDISNFKLP